MLQEKTEKILLIALFVVVFGLTRFLYLGPDEINPDGVNWHYRSQQFTVALKSGNFLNTYQHYHPGVTLMWISGVPIEVYKQLTGVQTYNQYNFLTFNFIAKASVVLVQLVLTLLILCLLPKIIGFYKAYLVVAVLSLEPFFLGNSRLYHMDVLLTLFMFLSLICLYLSFAKKSKLYAVLTGLFIALSFLTKSIGISILAFSLAYSLYQVTQNRKNLKYLNYLGLILGTALVATFLLFPALWVKPIFVIQNIFSESARVGVRDGHSQIILGEYTENAGPLFYPFVLVLKTSPFTIFGILLFVFSFLVGIVKVKKRSHAVVNAKSFLILLAVFYISYLIVMSVPSKKLDRYMLPEYPFMAFIAVYGYEKLLKYFKQRKFYDSLVCALASVFLVLPIITFYPYYFTYTSPIFGTTENANKLIAQKGFGIGIVEVRNLILQKHGERTLGFYDTKPIDAIYANSKVFDVRTYGPGKYDLLVLGVNEDYPDKVIDNNVKFIKDSSIYINGLEYWRIYVKEIN